MHERHDSTAIGFGGLILLGVASWAVLIAALRAWVGAVTP